ncbi:hypothetical protein [Levilactobacillus namurensis]|uniref:hypothetical protein n=1 Tax=Levilactobacillus namurensis TaxID=380393 RepID=UPI000463211B|nr:hypothetical protein [Levilactobacillus namurensis]
MNKLVYGLIAGAAGLGLWLSLPTSAHAMGASYSATRSNSVRLVWRRSMGHYQYHNGNRGARYSKHLGVRYSPNDMTNRITWITDAHEKLYNRDTHTYDIYYHVHNANKSIAGWIWRGYLSAGAAPQVSQAPRKTAQSSSSTRPLTLADFKSAGPSTSRTDLNALATFGHGARPNNQYMAFARYMLTQTIAHHFNNELPDSYYENNPDNPGNYHDSLFEVSNNLGPGSPTHNVFNAESPSFMAFLKSHGLDNFGGGPNKYLVCYYTTEEKISPDNFIFSLTSDDPYLMTDTASLGHNPQWPQGAYMASYNIGVASTQVSNKRVASFVIYNNPTA